MKLKKINLIFVKKIIPVRQKKSSKIDGGKVLIIGGGKGLYGAGILSALSSTRAGAGYTHLMSDLKKFPWISYPDFIVHTFSMATLKKHSDAVIGIGPGMGTTIQKKKFLTYLIKNKFPKVVVDGDALTLLSKMKVKSLPESWILTPHEGELSRLLNVTSLRIKQNRLKYVQDAQKKYGCTVILKGADTLIASTESLFMVSSGTVALAKAGTGDVLVGLITALWAQGLGSVEAAVTGCFIHGYASQLWMDDKKDYLSMRPVDLIEKIPAAIYKIRKN